MRSLFHDTRLALRRLRLSPGFTLFAIASLAIAIRVSTAIYSAVRTLLWTPLGVLHEQALATVTRSGARMRVMSWVDFEELRRQQTTASAVAAGIPIH
ncbi:MAG TPA: hypothetical protein VEL79_10980, partial [Vicinamibacterales bacterium]|nr:hypothetical protein [Vicinamibacterales bacterium]